LLFAIVVRDDDFEVIDFAFVEITEVIAD